MCKVDSDTVIGNFLIEAVLNKKFQVGMDQLLQYDSFLSQGLLKYNYFTNLNAYLVASFVENYPFFVDLIDDVHIVIKSDHSNEKVINSLKRYFRYGISEVIITEMQSAYENILG